MPWKLIEQRSSVRRPNPHWVLDEEEQAFIRAIAERPDDDGPRLIFADWLDEIGDERADFIRTQCALARETDPLRLHNLKRHEAKLVDDFGDVWLEPLGTGLIRGIFTRGMLEQVEVHPDHLLAYGGDWFRWFPIDKLQVALRGHQIDSFASKPWLQHVRSLRLSESELGDQGCMRVLGSPHIGPLDELWLRSTGIGLPALRWLVQSPLIARLRVLLLSGNTLGDEGAQILARAPSLEKLEVLYIAGCGMSWDAAAAIKTRYPGLEISYK
jgi:uncharacterized protein (TIGR02996 family)